MANNPRTLIRPGLKYACFDTLCVVGNVKCAVANRKCVVDGPPKIGGYKNVPKKALCRLPFSGLKDGGSKNLLKKSLC